MDWSESFGYFGITESPFYQHKNGIAFLLSATIVWSVITVIFTLPLSLHTKNIFTLISTGLIFPTAILLSKIIKADWKNDDNPLNILGIHLNIAQLLYFPIIFWAFIQSPADMIIFFAIITGAHFFPYGWFYRAPAYYIMAPFISITMMLVGWTLAPTTLWWVPIVMVISLVILIFWLYGDYKRKCTSPEKQ
ncbi:DUF7010 family protein [Aliibacillus thermotolerans]|uniref:DUF7010 family protein n=1 Tax=Aliibacillus thermotolerans TaxID=1834418 RepID=A0ABW0U3Q2_9BACI|nr:hypothetical protein [Aliibacillus thermotolerans]